MECFKIVINEEEYIIEQHDEIKGLFSIRYNSVVQKILRTSSGEWSFLYRIPFTSTIPFEEIAREIEKEIFNTQCIHLFGLRF